jgi:pimeloyl-ACP methyl ester carboxylesterase
MNYPKYHPENKFYYDKNSYINYRIIGNGDFTLVLLHGYGASNYTWDDIIPYLNNTRYKIILIDLPGYGFSSLPEKDDYSINTDTDIIINFLKQTKIINYSLVGHSYGGSIILNIVIKINSLKLIPPDSIILLDVAAYKTRLPFFINSLRIPILNNILLKLITVKYRVKYTLENIYFDKTKVTNEKIYRYVYFLSMKQSNTVLLKRAKQIIPNDYDKIINQYKTIKIPTLIIWGVQDTTLSVDCGNYLANEIKNSCFISINESGHNVQEEQPEKVVLEINRFLKNIYE